MTDLRVIACILDAGRKAALDMEDAALAHTLACMTEVAVSYQLTEDRAANIDDPTGLNGPALREAARGVWNLPRDFDELAEPHR